MPFAYVKRATTFQVIIENDNINTTIVFDQFPDNPTKDHVMKRFKAYGFRALQDIDMDGLPFEVTRIGAK